MNNSIYFIVSKKKKEKIVFKKLKLNVFLRNPKPLRRLDVSEFESFLRLNYEKCVDTRIERKKLEKFKLYKALIN